MPFLRFTVISSFLYGFPQRSESNIDVVFLICCAVPARERHMMPLYWPFIFYDCACVRNKNLLLVKRSDCMN